MKALAYYCAFYSLLTGFFIPVEVSGGQSQVLVSREVDWSAPGQEILTPQFSRDGNFVTLVTRVYVPDGGDAEGLPESFFESLKAKEKADPRFADPVIKVIDMRGKVTCEAKYGWNPSLGRDDNSVVFAEQVKPITGFRALAFPMEGNGIRMHDCATGQTVKIADSQTGYLDTPFFSPDGGSIVYTHNENVNGEFGGAIDVARFDLQRHQESILIEKKTVAAIACPPAGSKESSLEAFKCSQAGNFRASFPQIIYDISSEGNDAVALLGIPIPAAGDMYVASSYKMSIVSLLPVQRTVLSLGTQKLESEHQISFQGVSGERVLVFSEYWRLFSLATGKPLPDSGPRNRKERSVYSPDLKYYLCAEASERGEEPDHFVLYRTAGGERLKSLPRMALVYGAVWSPGSNRFATFGIPMAGASVMHHAEELLVYSVR